MTLTPKNRVLHKDKCVKYESLITYRSKVIAKGKFLNGQTETDRQTTVKQYAPDLSMREGIKVGVL